MEHVSERVPPAVRVYRQRPLFRDAAQLGEVCATLLERAGLPGYWGKQGPTGDAGSALLGRDAWMPISTHSLLVFTWALWNRRSLLTVSQMLDDLQPEHLRLVGEVLVAAADGYEAIDAWLKQSNGDAPDSGADEG